MKYPLAKVCIQVNDHTSIQKLCTPPMLYALMTTLAKSDGDGAPVPEMVVDVEKSIGNEGHFLETSAQEEYARIRGALKSKVDDAFDSYLKMPKTFGEFDMGVFDPKPAKKAPTKKTESEPKGDSSVLN